MVSLGIGEALGNCCPRPKSKGNRFPMALPIPRANSLTVPLKPGIYKVKIREYRG